MIKQINKEKLTELLGSGATLVDVRENPTKQTEQAIDKSEHWPLSTFGLRQKDISHSRPTIFYCRSGLLSTKAAEIAEDWTNQEVYTLEGGLLKFHES